MADLDDFFAKKDRKKTKKCTNFEERKVEKPKKALSAQTGEELAVSVAPREEEEEEWKEYVEEKKDYTGLKIQHLTMQEQVEEEVEEDMEENEQGEMRKKGPWKAIDVEAAPGAAASQLSAKPDKAASPVPMAGRTGKYVSPHLRHQPPPSLRTNKGKTVAPDIMNPDFFPTLSAAVNDTPVSWGKKKQEAAFEEVRNSKSHSNRDDMRENQGLEVGNKFGALEPESS